MYNNSENPGYANLVDPMSSGNNNRKRTMDEGINMNNPVVGGGGGMLGPSVLGDVQQQPPLLGSNTAIANNNSNAPVTHTPEQIHQMFDYVLNRGSHEDFANLLKTVGPKPEV